MWWAVWKWPHKSCLCLTNHPFLSSLPLASHTHPVIFDSFFSDTLKVEDGFFSLIFWAISDHRRRNTRYENWLLCCVITFEPIMIKTCLETRNDRLIFSFVKDIEVVVKKMTWNCCKMVGKTADSLLCPFHSIQFSPLVLFSLCTTLVIV